MHKLRSYKKFFSKQLEYIKNKRELKNTITEMKKYTRRNQ